ncbi:ABC transporter ATP-binding protein [Streptomyces tsukubensis]|uniref:ABC transporter domain-containing protein n=1 Tax=Streptomyces tsukubensis TaxID=83656 RepID=A0A1V4AFA7_9ACTN|nr:ABC transporter ATP-binding protein [Streptomyces tsukubensis]OON82562.1 hypothetical protein B1H18_00290 [Streptomyces tsukubensis]QFR92276.1 ATP-binding cassette domain-containing protein [Streptomyces tsukubensis]
MTDILTPLPAADATRSRAAPAPLLDIAGLSVSYGRRATSGRDAGHDRVLADVGLSVAAGEIVGVIGETGSGKTTLARATVGLVRPETGTIRFEGRDLSRLSTRELRDFRRSGRVQYMFQDPLRSQDPELTVRAIVAEPLAATGALTRRERVARADEALALVGLDPETFGGRTPGQISGGQRQRVSLARSVVTRPRLLLSDEPVSALDASNRNLVLALLDRLRRELGLAVVVISHDLSSLAGIADRVAVLYRGRLVEEGPVARVLEYPRHPYTALLTASAPSVRREHRLLPAQLRAPADREPRQDDVGCVFAPRCRFADPECDTEPDTVSFVATEPEPETAVAASVTATGVVTAADTVTATAASVAVTPAPATTANSVSRTPSANGTAPDRTHTPTTRPAHRTVACHHAATWRENLT